jgi:hypothetical protein
VKLSKTSLEMLTYDPLDPQPLIVGLVPGIGVILEPVAHLAVQPRKLHCNGDVFVVVFVFVLGFVVDVVFGFDVVLIVVVEVVLLIVLVVVVVGILVEFCITFGSHGSCKREISQWQLL